MGIIGVGSRRQGRQGRRHANLMVQHHPQRRARVRDGARPLDGLAQLRDSALRGAGVVALRALPHADELVGDVTTLAPGDGPGGGGGDQRGQEQRGEGRARGSHRSRAELARDDRRRGVGRRPAPQDQGQGRVGAEVGSSAREVGMSNTT